LQCLGFDLAVLLANYVIERGFMGFSAMRVFDEDSVPLIEKMHRCWKDSSRRLGLSWRKQLKGRWDDFYIAKPFRLVRDDLSLLVTAPGDHLELSAPELSAGFSDPPAQPGSALHSEPPIPTRPVLKVGSMIRLHGFKADTDRHNAIAEIVGRHYSPWNVGSQAWRRKSLLKRICEDLDHAEIDTPRGWRTGKTASLQGTKLIGWGEAFHLDYRKLIIDAIRYSLKIVLRPLAGESKSPM
jgi:hypothetical protein